MGNKDFGIVAVTFLVTGIISALIAYIIIIQILNEKGKEIDGITTQLVQSKKDLISAQQEIQDLNVQLKAKQKELDDVTNLMNVLQDQNKNLNDQLAQLRSRFEQINQEHELFLRRTTAVPFHEITNGTHALQPSFMAPHSLVAWWKFDEGQGDTAADSSQNKFTATLVNNPAWVEGRSGKYALNFDGMSQYVSTNLENMNFPSGTVSWWMKPTDAYNSGDMSAIFAQFEGGQEFTCQDWNDGNWYCGWNDRSGIEKRATCALTADNFVQNQWGYYTLTWGPNGTNLYYNASMICSNNSIPPVLNLNTPFLIAKHGSANEYFKGALADFKIYNYALSDAEILNEFRDTQHN